MKLRLSLIVVGVIVVATLIYKGCQHLVAFFPSNDVPVLKDGEKAKAVFSRNTITVVKRGTDRPVTYHVPKYGTMIVKDDGDVVVSAKRAGLTFEPGIGLGIGADDFRASLDVKWFYWGRWGVNSGINGRLRKDLREINPRFHIGVSYALPFEKLSNTSFVLGVDNRKDVYGYIRVGF